MGKHPFHLRFRRLSTTSRMLREYSTRFTKDDIMFFAVAILCERRYSHSRSSRFQGVRNNARNATSNGLHSNRAKHSHGAFDLEFVALRDAQYDADEHHYNEASFRDDGTLAILTQPNNNTVVDFANVPTSSTGAFLGMDDTEYFVRRMV